VAPGDQFLIVASIKNVGTGSATGYYLDVYYDSDYGRGGPDTIAPGETQVWYVGALTAQAGTHASTWTVDPDNQIAELDESNNQKQYTFTIGAQTTTTTSTSNSTTVLTTQTTQTSTNTTTSTTTTSTSTSTTTTTSSTSTTSSPPAVSITLTANPSGSIVVDGTTYPSQQTFTWIPGSSHTITANSPVLGDSGTQYVWASWADGGDQSRTITTPSSPTTYTANYQTQYQVTYSQTGCSLPVSLPATEWVNAGNSAVGTFPSTVSSGDGKTQCPLQNASPPGPINAPTALAATYKTQYYLTVTSSYGNPTGQGWYDAGSTATFAVTSPASGGAGTQYAFTGWVSSDTGGYTGADASHSFTVNSPITETASWKTQWEVTFAVNPSGDGSITVSGQSSVTTWYDDGAVINIQASPNTGYAYSSWSSDTASIVFTDSSASTTVTIHGTGTITANFLLTDTTAPVITPAVTPTANSNGWNTGPVTVSWSVSDPESGIASSDGCATTTLNNETPLEGTTLTCTVTNNAGLSNSASVTVKIDLAAPTLTLPSPTVEATGPSGATVSYDASASDSLSGLDTFSCTAPSGSTFPIATTTVSCSATDKAGNIATGTFAVVVQDKTPPVVTVPSDMTVDATGSSGAVVTFTGSASDVMDGSVPVTCTPASGSTFPVGATKVTCSATDKAGNNATGTFTVTVQDSTPPVVTVPADITAEAAGPNGAIVTFTASALDAVDGDITPSCSPASGSTFAIGSTRVTCSATDKAGNTATATFTVTVEDKAPPVLSVPADMIVEASGASGAIVTFTASASDAMDGSVSVTCTPASGSTFALGENAVSCASTDKAGNKATGSFKITVVDTTAPTLTLPSDMTEAAGSAGVVVSYTATASDLVDGSLTASCTPASGSTFSSGTTTVTCSATDRAGNIATGTFTVTVQDKAPPVVTVPADMTVNATSKDGAVVTFTTSALDAADGSLTPTCTPSSGSTFALGSTKVTCSGTDKAGNTASGSFTVTVVDRTPPSLTLPSDMTVQATSTSGAVGTFSASASDLVDGTVPVTCTPASGSTFPAGTTGVTCSAKDKAGNSASGSFQVTVPAVTVKLLSSNGNGLSGGVVQYYSGGWKSFGTTGSDGTVRMALPPGTYIFQISYAGASLQKSQNVASDPNVAFQTVQVHSDSGKCTSYIQVAIVPTRYYGGGWQVFTQDMELLPGTYMFRFSDGTKNASYMLVVGAVMHIH